MRRNSMGGLFIFLFVLGVALQYIEAILWIVGVLVIGYILLLVNDYVQSLPRQTFSWVTTTRPRVTKLGQEPTRPKPILESSLATQTDIEDLAHERSPGLDALPTQQLPAEMNPYAFEILVGKLCEAMGLTANTVGQTGDGGIDIRAENTAPLVGGKYVIQCKRYKGSVPVKEVRDLFGVVMAERASKGVLITTGNFTLSGYEFAGGQPLELIDGEMLGKLLREHNLVDEHGHLHESGR